MKIGTRVTTPHGLGTIVGIEQFSRVMRYAVRLDKEPFPFTPVAYYFPTEIKQTI